MVNLTDFGLSKKYVYSNIIHIPYNENRPFVGTLNYASYNTHLGIQQSRRDDLESYCYILSYLVKGRLPWSPAKGQSKIAEKDVKRMKNSIQPSSLYNDSHLNHIFSYVKALAFEEQPNYQYIFNLLNRSIQESKQKIFKVRFIEEKNCKSLLAKKPRKKTAKPKKASKTITDLSTELQDNSTTMISESFPEIKDRKNFTRVLPCTVKSDVLKLESHCFIF
jgi:serine/threonine protein kinase